MIQNRKVVRFGLLSSKYTRHFLLVQKKILLINHGKVKQYVKLMITGC